MNNYFQIFELAQDFEIDLSKLEQNYFALMQKFHPDKFIADSEENRLIAVQNSVTINDGYGILKSPLKRAEYLLSLGGIIVNKDNIGVKPNMEILTKSMEDREALALANPDEITVLKKQALADKEQSIKAIAQYFRQEKLDKAAQETIKLRYIEKFIEEIRK